jgi:ubiquinone/menaquinone biosynthesis C-methylase UbiE
MQQKKPPYVMKNPHDPEGTGIFYLDREIAQVMGHEAADWLERPEREREEAPTKMLRALKLKPGQTVADIGAGSGFLSVKMAGYVGKSGRVFAVDIQPEMLALIDQKKKQLRLPQLFSVLGTVTDPKVPKNSCDLMLLVDVYHEFDHPYEMTEAMVSGLKVGGRLVLVEYRREDPRVPIKLTHKMSEAQARQEMALFPLRFVENIGILPWQHILVFEKTK